MIYSKLNVGIFVDLIMQPGDITWLTYQYLQPRELGWLSTLSPLTSV